MGIKHSIFYSSTFVQAMLRREGGLLQLDCIRTTHRKDKNCKLYRRVCSGHYFEV